MKQFIVQVEPGKSGSLQKMAFGAGWEWEESDGKTVLKRKKTKKGEIRDCIRFDDRGWMHTSSKRVYEAKMEKGDIGRVPIIPMTKKNTPAIRKLLHQNFPVVIGGQEVEFSKDGIVAGCVNVSKNTVKRVYDRLFKK